MDEQTSQTDVEMRLLEAPTVRDHLADFALRASRHLGSGTEVSISMRHAGTDRLVASSSGRATRCDEVEYRTGEGPCIAAMDLMQVVLVPDLVEESRWGPWRRASLDEGYRSGAGVPAHVADGVEVVLNLYSEQVDPWDADLIVRADTYAQQVAVTVGLCLQVAQLAAAYADAQAALRELERLTALVVAAVVDDGASAPALRDRIAEVARTAGPEAPAVVRSLLHEVTAGSRGPEA